MVSQKNAQQSAGLKKYLSRSSGVVGAAGHGSTLRNKWGDGKWRLLRREGNSRKGSSLAEVISLRKGFKKKILLNGWGKMMSSDQQGPVTCILCYSKN